MSEDELSDLTSEEDELSYEDGKPTQGTSSSRATRKSGGNDGGYKLQKALKPPRATTYTAQALYDQIHNGDINLEPEYQRDVVWTKEKQTGLIDSILRNFYIPPIIFAVNIHDDGSENRTCIDGKQRLTSIHRFMDGIIPHRDPITNERLWYRDDSKSAKTAKSKKLLPAKYRTIFANKQIVCVEYGDLTDSDERDIFQRVQLGMALTSAEKLHVINTPRAKFVRSILETYVTEETLASPVLPWDTNRGSDFRCIAQAIYCMEKWGTTKNGGREVLRNAGSLPQVEKWLVASSPDGKKGKDTDAYSSTGVEVSESFAKKVKETYDIFVKLATTSKYSAPFTAYPKVSPIEMICIAILIYVHGVLPLPASRLNLSELSDVISRMRDDVRSLHKDIRLNDRVGKTMIEFIKVVSKDSPTKKSRKQDSETASTTSTKRKRQSAAIDDDDDDYHEPPRTQTKRSPAASSPTRRKAKLQEVVPSGSGPRAPSTSSISAPGSRRSDPLASLRAAKAATMSARRDDSMPNPQKLPSPGPGPGPGSGPGFAFSGSLLNGSGGPQPSQHHLSSGDNMSAGGFGSQAQMEQMWRGMMGGVAMPQLANGMHQMHLGMQLPGMPPPPPGSGSGSNNSS